MLKLQSRVYSPHVSIIDDFVIGSTSVAVVEHGRIIAPRKKKKPQHSSTHYKKKTATRKQEVQDWVLICFWFVQRHKSIFKHMCSWANSDQ